MTTPPNDPRRPPFKKGDTVVLKKRAQDTAWVGIVESCAYREFSFGKATASWIVTVEWPDENISQLSPLNLIRIGPLERLGLEAPDG